MEVVEGCLDSRLAEFIVELRDLKDEVATGRQERQLLIEENKELKARIMYLEKLADNNEQYSRRNCLVLSGEDLPRQVLVSQVSRRSQPRPERLLRM